jgi:hypothetical protein
MSETKFVFREKPVGLKTNIEVGAVVVSTSRYAYTKAPH